MNAVKSIGWVVSLSIVAGGLMATSAQAQKVQSSFGSFSDISGTNIWNNIPPIFEGGAKLDPQLVENITRVNQEGEAAFQACNAALAQIEQNAPATRRFSRRPSTLTAEVPVACRQLEQLRAEADTLRAAVEEAKRLRAYSDRATW
ncbi:MAG: hypothetical protein Fur006_65630 [Coleofasciculaceae cyanobacterium]